MTYIPFEKIVDHLPVQTGDALYIASDIRMLIRAAQLNGEKFDVARFTDSFLNRLGETGTLILPTFNWDFCKGIAFDHKNTPSMTGSLTQRALGRSDFSRTQHPIYSFAVWGRDRKMLCDMVNKSSFGADSPFAYLKTHAKCLMISTTFSNSLTFYHHVEEQSGHAKYRYLKDFTADYVDADGARDARTYSMFVRNLDLDVRDASWGMYDELLHKGIVREAELNGARVSSFSFAEIYEPILRDILHNRSRKLCTYIGQNDY